MTTGNIGERDRDRERHSSQRDDRRNRGDGGGGTGGRGERVRGTPRGMTRLVMLHSLSLVPLTLHLFPPPTLVSAQY